MTIYSIVSISGLLNGIGALFIILLTLLHFKKNLLFFVFIFLNLAIAIWAFSYWHWLSLKDYSAALFWTRMLNVGAILIPILSFHWIVLLIEKAKQNKIFLWGGYLITAIFLIFSSSSLFVRDVEPTFNFLFWPKPGILYHFYIVSYVFLLGYGVYQLFKEYRVARGYKKAQMRFVFWGWIIAVPAGFSNFLLWYNINFPPFLNIFVLAYISFFAYAILKHRLMDIRVAIGRLVVYGLYFATALLVGLLIAFLNSRLAQPLPFLAIAPFIAVASVAICQLLGYYHKIAQYFYPTFRNTEMTIAKLEEKLTEVLEADTMASLVVTTLKQVFQLQKLAILVKNLNGPLSVRSNIGFNRLTLDSFTKTIEPSLIPVLQKIKKPFGVEEVAALSNRVKPLQIADLQQLVQLLQTNQINAVVPLWFRKRLVGLVVLGEKANQDPFTIEDFQLLAALSYQTSIALHNANLYSEVKKRKEELERFYRLTVGREVKMIELKKKNLELEEKLKNGKV